MIEQFNRKIATVFAILILCTTPTLVVYQPASATTTTGIMIPLYSYPGSYWTQVIQVKNAYPSVPIAVIVNPNNGPGSAIDQNYVTGIQQMQAAGITVLGYVYTHYGARSTSSVEADINTWNSWYHVNGINFDEMANTAGYESYYSTLSNYAKSLGMTMTVGNPGTSTISSYVGTVDVLDIYESSGMPSTSQIQSYTFNGAYPKSDFAFIGLGVGSLPSLATMTTYSNYVAWMYITDNGGSNPYNNVPSYLSTEVSLLAAVAGTGGTTTTAPGSPTGLTASAASSSQINLSWTAPSSNGGSSITGYEIDRSTDGGSTWSVIQSNTGSTGTSYSDTGLAASTAYTYRVSAINGAGTSSPSGDATATTQAGTPTATAPGSPTGLTATAASSSQINLSWTAPSSNGGSSITGYEIDRSANAGSTWTTVSSNTGSTGTSYSDTGLAASTAYTYRVSAINAAGTSSPSGDATATTQAGTPTATAPGSPTGLTATAASSSQINLSWTAPSSNGGSSITGYEIDRSTDGGSTWSVIQSSTGSTGTSYSDTGLAASTAYAYRVSAINAAGTSSPSGDATATTQVGSGGSTGGTTGSIAISNIQSTSGTISASPYQMTLANVNAGTGSNRVLVVGVEANNNNVVSVTFGGVPLAKEVSSFANNDAEFWYLVNPTGTGNVVVTMAGSTSAVVGAYSLSGVDQANPIPTTATNHNTSPGSPTVSITTANPNSLVLDSASIWGGVTLGSPTCTQGWDANIPSAVTGASSSRSTTSAGAVTCGWTASGSGDLWDDVAIEVKASGVASATGGTTTTAPGSPTGLTATAASSSQINLSWTAPSSNGGSSITGYEIDRSANAGSTWTTVSSNTGSTGTSYSDTGLAASTAYTYRVSAINAAGTSSPSGDATATTQAGTPTSPSPGKTVSLTVNSDNLGGSQFSGMWVELHASNGTILATGYTPVTFSVTSGVQYVVFAANYQSNVFNHWQDGTANSSLTITPAQNTSLTAYYSTAVTLTVKSVDLSGNAFSGMWTVVKSGGNTVATGYTPFQYSAQGGNTYTITVGNYQNYVFSHWSDGSTNATRTVTPTQDTTLVAYYST